jgi:hypothetical protein
VMMGVRLVRPDLVSLGIITTNLHHPRVVRSVRLGLVSLDIVTINLHHPQKVTLVFRNLASIGSLITVLLTPPLGVNWMNQVQATVLSRGSQPEHPHRHPASTIQPPALVIRPPASVIRPPALITRPPDTITQGLATTPDGCTGQSLVEKQHRHTEFLPQNLTGIGPGTITLTNV